MYNLKGFVKIRELLNNSGGVISPLGELSTFALTYTKERGEYENSLYPGLTLVSFSSKQTNTGTVSVAPNYVDHVLNVINSIYQYSKTFVGTVTNTEILNHIVNIFGNSTQGMEVGTLVSATSVKLPEWISWTNPSMGPNRFKIWLSDIAFVKQYDEYDITILPPTENLDDLFRESSVAARALEALTPMRIMESIQTLKNKNPETVIRAETFSFTSPLNENYKRDITWYAIVHGGAGDNTDIIRNEIITHALNNSSFDTNQWKAIVPDLFRATEFILVPSWLNYAIPNRTVQTGIYSPVSTIVQVVNEFKAKIPFIVSTHIDSHLQLLVHPYRSLSIACVGNVDNKESKFKITDHFPDFISVGTTSTDYNRMTKATQEWTYQLQELLIIAENLNAYPDLPANVRKVTRANQIFLAKTINSIQYLIYAKANLGS